MFNSKVLTTDNAKVIYDAQKAVGIVVIEAAKLIFNIEKALVLHETELVKQDVKTMTDAVARMKAAREAKKAAAAAAATNVA